jgi:nitrogen fixation-related uncharacterized protein
MERATLAGVVWVVQDLTVRDSKAGAVSTFLGIVIAAVSVFTLAVVAWAFIWAAKKDGEEDRASRSASVSADALGSGDSPRPIFPLIVRGHSGTLATPLRPARPRRSEYGQGRAARGL